MECTCLNFLIIAGPPAAGHAVLQGSDGHGPHGGDRRGGWQREGLQHQREERPKAAVAGW